MVSVLDINTTLKQLVLYMREPVRQIRVNRSRWDPILKKTYRWDETFTTPGSSTFLIGEDEDHPFICMLPELAWTVEQAHECLKPDEVKKLKKDEYVRQGEWFFVPTKIKFHHRKATRKTGIIKGRGRPHQVSEYINIWDYENKQEFIRGNVNHPDHRTLKFSNWARVYGNKEKILDLQLSGINWFD